jgi:hypothetical protein
MLIQITVHLSDKPKVSLLYHICMQCLIKNRGYIYNLN